MSWGDLKEGIEAYYFGRYGVALKEFQVLAEQGVAEAQFYLGVMYAKGRGTAQDYAEAARWYRLAAEQGSTKAMSNLGLLYSKGKGVSQSYELAVRWYQEAADQQLPEAQYNLGVMYASGQGVRRNWITAYMWFNLAAMNGHANAVRSRAVVAKMMTRDQIVQAQRLAREWSGKKIVELSERQGEDAEILR